MARSRVARRCQNFLKEEHSIGVQQSMEEVQSGSLYADSSPRQSRVKEIIYIDSEEKLIEVFGMPNWKTDAPHLKTINFSDVEALQDFLAILKAMTPGEQEAYKKENGLIDWHGIDVWVELIHIIEAELEYQRSKAQEAIDKIMAMQKTFIRETIELALERIQRDDRAVMCPVGNGRPSSKGMRGFDSDSLCQILKGLDDEEGTCKDPEAA